jgi:hypothetical protein
MNTTYDEVIVKRNNNRAMMAYRTHEELVYEHKIASGNFCYFSMKLMLKTVFFNENSI